MQEHTLSRINLHSHTKQMGVSPISSYVTGETINTLSAPSTNRLAESPASQKEQQQKWRESAGDDNFGGVTRERGKVFFFYLYKEKSLGKRLKRSTGVIDKKKDRMRDRQHVQGIDKQMDHMWYWQGTEFHNQPASHQLLKQTDTVSEPSGQLVQPAKM